MYTVIGNYKNSNGKILSINSTFPTREKAVNHVSSLMKTETYGDFVVTIKEKENIKVELNEVEMGVLITILVRVGGSPNGLRGFADEILTKLRQHSYVRYDDYLARDNTVANTLYFKDELPVHISQ